MPQLSHLNVVLHVEDAPLVSIGTDEVLQKAGVGKVIHAATVHGALAVLGSEKIDAAIVDIQLRDGESHDVLAKLARNGIPFVIASGAPPSEAHRQYSAYRLNKPVGEEQLVAALERLTALDNAPMA